MPPNIMMPGSPWGVDFDTRVHSISRCNRDQKSVTLCCLHVVGYFNVTCEGPTTHMIIRSYQLRELRCDG